MLNGQAWLPVDAQMPLTAVSGHGSWLVDGSLSVEEFKEGLNINSLPEEESGLYQSIGGFVMMRLEKVPSTGDHFEWDGYRFEVMDMDERRVDKLLVTPLAKKDG